QGAARGTGGGVGGEVELHLGVRGDHGADVATLDHDVTAPDDLALELEEPGAHGRDGGDGADGGGDVLAPDLDTHVGAVHVDGRPLRVGARGDHRSAGVRGHCVRVVHVHAVTQHRP